MKRKLITLTACFIAVVSCFAGPAVPVPGCGYDYIVTIVGMAGFIPIVTIERAMVCY